MAVVWRTTVIRILYALFSTGFFEWIMGGGEGGRARRWKKYIETTDLMPSLSSFYSRPLGKGVK